MEVKDLHNIETAIEFYDHRYEAGYMEEWAESKKNKVKEVLLQLELPSKAKALDFGCGNGVFTRIIKDVFPAWDVYGVEISKIAVQNAARKFPDCTFFSADDANKYKNQFNFLFSHHVIEHVQNLDETFEIINSYLMNHSYQLHILPSGNAGSYEHHICTLLENGIEKNRGNRFFFEEDGHLQRLTTDEFAGYENKIRFELKKDFYSNQELGAINWITKSSPRFVKRLTNTLQAKDDKAAKELLAIRKKLLPLTYLQFAYSKYWDIKSKWNKGISDYLKIFFLFIPAMISKPIYKSYQKRASTEWEQHKTERNGSEMYLFFTR